MSLYLYFFLAGCFCYSSNAIPEVTVMQNKVATLPCPCGKGNVTWSRFINGKKVTLVKIKNGVEERFDKRYGSLADNSLTGQETADWVLSLDQTRRETLKTQRTNNPQMFGRYQLVSWWVLRWCFC
ncbi:uncharacterized protein LOC129117002 isoform X2 [Anoplopoma fimbria]|uniref:uncharacterized protein LOC129117002 isoform X2 n=1 Tax=Anoplopoma fimbria TaxID=229290 RepID=UPI0023EDCFC9|nr:uncharacterized protein LOC129117002 isoform X2 [Anoplopoma fimbria]